MFSNSSKNNKGDKKLDFASQHLILGEYHLIKNEFDKAIEEYAKAIKINPGYLKAHYYLAEACFAKALKQEQLSEREKRKLLIIADNHYQKVVVSSPESDIAQKAISRLADLYEKLEQI